MIGDGLDDAGALSESMLGISIADDVYQFSPACDGILQADQFANIDRYLRFSKISLGIVAVSFSISFLYNFIGIFFAIQGILSPIIAAILMPVSSVSVVAFATISVSVMSKKFFQI